MSTNKKGITSTELILLKQDQPIQVLKLGQPYNSHFSSNSTKMAPGHPEGIFDAMGNLYRGFAKEVRGEQLEEGEYPTVHDGVTFERFLKETHNHSSVKMLYDPSHFVLQQLDYLQYIDFYHEYIRMFHVKDAEFNPNGKLGVYGGYEEWIDRPGRFRSLGDGQVDFKNIFSKLSQYGYDGWAVLEWECCINSQTQGAIEGVLFISEYH